MARDPETAYARTPLDTTTALATVDRRRVLVNADGQAIRRDPEVFEARPINPGPPLYPWLPRGEDPRQFYILSGYNLNYVPRAEFPTLTPFQLLRNLAATSDLVQIARQDVINSILALEWDVVPEDKRERRAHGMKAEVDYAKNFLEYPDRVHGFEGWLHTLLIDMLDLDALCFYRRRTMGGEPHSLMPIDGSTIKPVLDFHGIPPEPPEVAYQQIIAGVPETEFSRPYLPVMEGQPEEYPTELVYCPFSPRTYNGYGQSPLERVLITVNLALRRQLHHLAYFTDGNIPDAFWKCPDNWNADQVFGFQDRLEKQLSGESGARRKMRMMPGGEGTGLELPHGSEQEPNNLNEFMARVIAMAYHTSPQPLVAMMNRATAEQADQSTSESGLHMWLHKIRKLMTREIREFLGFRGLRFIYTEDKHRDETAWTAKAIAFVGSGIYTRNHILFAEGEEPIEGGDVVTVDTPSGPVPLVEFVGDVGAGKARPVLVGGEAGRILSAVPALPAAGGEAEKPEAVVSGDAPATPREATIPDEGKVQDTALNGAQIASLLEIVMQVASGELPYETGVLVIGEAFPTIPEAEARRMLESARVPSAAPGDGPAEVVNGKPRVAPVAAAALAEVPEIPAAAGKGVLVGKTEPHDCGKDQPPGTPTSSTADDLRRWRKVATKGIGDDAKWGKALGFASTVIPEPLQKAIRLSLEAAREPHAVDWTFRVLAKSRRPLAAIRRRLKHERAIKAVLKTHFAEHTAAVVALALAEFRAVRKADELEMFLPGLDEAMDLPALVEELTDPLRDAYLDGEVLAADASGIEIAYGLTDEQATAYASERAAELVGKRVLPDGTVIDSPNKAFAITESLRDDLQAAVTKALETGMSERELQEAIEAETGWTYRSDRIARTEVAVALNSGAAETYQGAGVESVLIIDGHGCLEDGHDDDQDGVDGEEWTVEKWQEHPVGHPNCTRDAAPIVKGME